MRYENENEYSFLKTIRITMSNSNTAIQIQPPNERT